MNVVRFDHGHDKMHRDEAGSFVKYSDYARLAADRDALQASIDALHPDTARLVEEFASALAGKLRAAEIKYGHTNGWLTEDWEHLCREHLEKHMQKGDPLDVAAYCAFMWRRGWSTTPRVMGRQS